MTEKKVELVENLHTSYKSENDKMSSEGEVIQGLILINRRNCGEFWLNMETRIVNKKQGVDLLDRNRLVFDGLFSYGVPKEDVIEAQQLVIPLVTKKYPNTDIKFYWFIRQEDTRYKVR